MRRAIFLLFPVVALVIFFPALRAPFIFDDDAAIVSNPNTKALFPLSRALWAPPNAPVAGRPVVSLSLAVNHALGGLDVFGYHLFNVLVHAGCAALVFLALRLALTARRLRARFESTAEPLALAVALIWLTHPLNSEAVIYVTQRTELLMAFFYLATVCCALQGLREPKRRLWPVLAVAACALGMGCKEVMVTAPVLVVLTERALHFESFAAAWKERSRFYLALAATWVPLAALVIAAPHAASVSEAGISPWQYLLNQCIAIPRYLAQSFVPLGLSLDYGEATPITFSKALPGGLLVLALLAASVWAWRKEPAWSLAGAWFFIILSPSSSFVPIFTEVAAERRVYLSLVAVLCAALVGAVWLAARATGKPLSGKVVLGVGLLLSTAGAAATRTRAADYMSPMTLWQGAVDAQPNNHRAHNNLAKLHFEAGRTEVAEKEYRAALALEPRYATAHANLCAVLFERGELEPARVSCAKSVELRPDVANNQGALAAVLARLGRVKEAETHYQKALSLSGDGRFKLDYGVFLAQQGNHAAALAQLNEVLAQNPRNAAARSALGGTLSAMGRRDEARKELDEALRLDSGSVTALANLGKLEASEQKWEAAIARTQQALALQPTLTDAQNTLVFAFLGAGKRAEARAFLEKLVAQRPNSVDARKNLGIVLAQEGDFARAQQAFLEALKLSPGNAELQRLANTAAERLSQGSPAP